MEIKVMGSGCANCKALYETMKQAAESLGLKDAVLYDTDIQHVIEMGILRLPAVVVDGIVVAQGRKFTVEDAEQLIQSRL